MKCPQFQTDISDDSRFCSKCGTPVQAAERIVFSQTRTILRPMEELAPETLPDLLEPRPGEMMQPLVP